MDIKSISYKKVIYIINQLIVSLGEMDDKIIKSQKDYNSKVNQMAAEYNSKNQKFERDCENAIASLQRNSKSMINEAQKIESQVIQMDTKLSQVDKYYLKTKKKKLQELSDKKSEKFTDNTDYFKILKDIKERYEVVSKKYSEEILPSILNSLNYIFSGKRKRDYEELIILKNTVEQFIEEMKKNLNMATEETIAEMKNEHDAQKQEMLNSQETFKKQQEDQYINNLNEISEEIERRFQNLLPDEIINFMASTIEEYKKSCLKVNTTNEIRNNIFYIGYVDFPVKEFIQSNTLISYITKKCEPLMIDNYKIRFPLILSSAEPFDIFIEKSDDGKVAIQQMVQGIMFSFLSSTPVMNLSFSVIDCQSHGNSVANYFDAKKKLPELFKEKFYTNQDEAVQRIYELNDRVDYISQEILGTEYNDIFEYKKENTNYNGKIEVLTIFDFPKGLDEQTLDALKNIIIYGKKCGIYVIIAGSSVVEQDYNSKEILKNIQKIKEYCVNLKQVANGFEYATLPVTSLPMPGKVEFKNFFEKYILINEGIKNKGIALPKDIRNLMNSKDDEELQTNIDSINKTIAEYEERFGKAPDESAVYLRKIPIGITHYPADLFADCFGYKKIMGEFRDESGKIALPLFMDCGASCNFLTTYSEETRSKMIYFANHIIWSALSMFPVTKLDISIIDCEQKGGSIQQFLDFKNECPDTFDEKIYTNRDDITELLEKLNKKIDDIIQNKLSNKYTNLLEYNQNNPNRSETCKLLVIYDFPSGMDNREIDILLNILKNGGKCGIYVLLGYNKDIPYSAYGGIEQSLNRIKQYSSTIEINDKNLCIAPFNLPISIKEPLDSLAINEFINNYKEVSKKIKGKGFSFEDILDKELFTRNTDKELSIPIGIGDGESIVPIVFGKGSSHHALVAGATGSGKSTLLHTLIMSAMLHYTPDLLNLYLMDFKGGTEFKIYDSYRLPHIKLLALDAMQEFGESILEDLVAEIERRSERFKSVNASKISEYVKLSGKAMPKILVIMDEFQILFNDSTNRKVANHCAELTKRIVTEGRSYGIHLLMATQSTKIIADLSLDSGTIEQMRIRVGLKCGEHDARYLFTDRNDMKSLEMMKGPIGTAVLNEEYTEKDLIGLRAAYCDDKTQEKYLELIAEKFANYEYDMQSFEGSKTIDLLSVLPSEMTNNLPVTIKVGPLIKVADPLEAVLDKKRKHNTLICGANEKMAENIVNLYTLGALLNQNVQVLYIDGDTILEGNVSEKSYYTEYSRFNERFKIAKTRGDIIKFIKEVYDFYLDSKKNMTEQQKLIIIKNFQYLDLLKNLLKGERIQEEDYIDEEEKEKNENEIVEPANPFDFGFDSNSSKEEKVNGKLMKLIDDGSAYGINFIITSLEFPSVKECMHYGENILPKFPERYVFALNETDADFLIDNVSLKSLKDNTVYYTDSLKNTFQLKPYIFPKKKELEEFLNQILKR